MSDNIWENGGEVNTTLLNTCTNFGQGSMCKDKDTNDLTFKARPYPSPNPNFFAVLDKPGVNRHVMRGCFKAQPDNQQNSPWSYEYSDHSLICDDYQGSYCAHSLRKEKCTTDAPGGLADFTDSMDTIGDSKYLENGFIIKQCECSMDSLQLSDSNYSGIFYDTKENGNSLYTCWADKHYRARKMDIFGVDISPDDCCKTSSNQNCIRNGKTINSPPGDKACTGDSECGDNGECERGLCQNKSTDNCNQFYYRGSDFTQYQPGELWDGRVRDRSWPENDEPSKCYHWYNPPLDELPDDKKDKNNCSQYLLKWAISCDWCKKNRPTDDGLKNCQSGTNNCNSPRKCGGDCTETLGGILQNSCESKLREEDCKICDSPLWDHIPGGWEALANKDHPKHLMAKFAYYPKVVKTDGGDCNQPNAVMAQGTPILTRKKGDMNNNDDVANNKSITTFIGLGPWKNDFINTVFNKDDYYENYTTNNPAGLVGNYKSCAKESWTNNNKINDNSSNTNLSSYCLNVTDENSCNLEQYCKWDNEKCLNITDNPINTDGSSENWSIWSDAAVVGNSNPMVSNLGTCNFKDGKSGYEYNPRSHTMCARNHNLTGYGESDKENGYLANLWLQGKWDMSQYTGKNNDIIEENITEEEKKQRKTEAIRCCLGLSPLYETTTKSPEHDPNLAAERHKYCRPGYVCPSSDACKDLFLDLFDNIQEGEIISRDTINYYQFGEAFPEGYQLEGSSELSDEIMENPSYYAKAYCEMMSGGTFGENIDAVNGCAHDSNAEINCRKAMYNYCSEPVQVNIQDPDGVGIGIDVKKIGYPLRVFSDTCKDWCSQHKLSDSLPSQNGVCDMAIGKTCQQLQVDGWIDPTNWGNSKLLKFADSGGMWIENPDIEPQSSKELKVFGTHENLTAKRIKNVCGCFLMGSECGSENCSVSYCGAGTDGNKGPGMASFRDNKDYKPSVRYNCGDELNVDGNYVNEVICDMKNVYDYDGDPEARGWTDNINKDTFSCYVDGNKDIGCFNGCNYVNTNDSCWMASPEERKQDLVFDIYQKESFNSLKHVNNWECKDDPVGDSCKSYKTDTIGCFGTCSINDYTLKNPKGNCGTSEWFDHRMNINPSEVNYKQRTELIKHFGVDTKPNVSYYWPQWQNFYTYWDQIPQSTSKQDPYTEYNIPGWGDYKTGSNGKPVSFDGSGDGTSIDQRDKNVCTFPSCADPDSVKPYRYYKNSVECPSNCSVSMQTNLNNQGAIIGGIVSSLNGKFACQTNENWNLTAISNSNNATYIGLMGLNDCSNQLAKLDNNNCTKCTLDSKDPYCLDCKQLLECGYGSDVCIDSTRLGVDPETNEDVISGDNCNVCIQPKSEICCVSPNINPYNNTTEKILWDKANSGENSLLQTLGNKVSYICSKSCPNGSVNLKDLENKNCEGIMCVDRTESNCADCETCTWTQEDKYNLIEGHCSAQCPLPPLSNKGWGFEFSDVPPYSVETSPSTSPSTSPPIITSNSNTINVVVGVVGALVLGGGVLWYFNKNKKRY